MPINTRVTVTVVSQTPSIFVPTLNALGIIGTTPGKLLAKNRMLSVSSITDISGFFSITDPEYTMMQTVLSQIPHGSTLMIFNSDRGDYKVASATSGVEANNNKLNFLAADPGFMGYLGDNIRVNILPPNAASINLSAITDQTLVTGSEPTLAVGTVGAKNGITFTSRLALTIQPTITINTGGTLALTASGNDVTVTLGTLTTAAQLIDAIVTSGNVAYNAAVAAILSAALTVGTGNDGSVAPPATAKTALVSNNLLLFTSKLGTTQVIRLTFAASAIANQHLNITTTNNGTSDAPAPVDINIALATDQNAAINSTAQNVVDALTTTSNTAYNATAAGWVSVAKYGTADGTQKMAAYTAKPIPFNVNITPATDADGNPTTTATALAAFVESGSVSLVTMLLGAANSGASNGTGIFNPSTFASLTSGADISNNTLKLTANKAGTSGGNITLTVTTGGGSTPVVTVTSNDISVAMASGGSSANGVANAINVIGSAAAALVTANANIGNSNGSGLVANAPKTNLAGGAAAANITVTLDRANTANSASELGRILNAFRTYNLNNLLPLPYFHLCTSLDDVAGDRLEISQAVAGGGDLFLGEYLTTNTKDEATQLQQGNAQPITSLITAMSSARTGFIVYDNTAQYRPDAALEGLWSAFEPGQFQTMWKTLQVIPPAKLSQTAQALIEGNAPGVSAGFTYVRFIGAGGGGGIPVTTGSWATDGSFLDNTWDDDWIKVHLQLATVLLLNSNPIVYGDRRGINKIKDVATRVMTEAANQGIVAFSDGSVAGFGDGKPIFILDFPTMATWDLLYQNLRNYRLAKIWFKRANAIEEVHYFVYATNDLAAFLGASLS